MFEDALSNILMIIAGLVVVIVIGIVLLAISDACFPSDWQCKINRYEAHVEACMETDRLTLDECRWLAATD